MGFQGQFGYCLFLALVLILTLGPGPARNCLQCDPTFAIRFASYAPRLSRKSWGLGDVPAAGRRLRGWVQDTLQEIHLRIPLEIPLAKLHVIAGKVYGKLDMLFKGKTYKPGILPEILNSIFKEQVSMLRDAIIESRVKCERHCGINWYDAVSCRTCNLSRPTCFGYNCESSEKWEDALNGLSEYINNLRASHERWKSAMQELSGLSLCPLASSENLNLTNMKAILSQNWLKTTVGKESDGEKEEEEAMRQLKVPKF